MLFHDDSIIILNYLLCVICVKVALCTNGNGSDYNITGALTVSSRDSITASISIFKILATSQKTSLLTQTNQHDHLKSHQHQNNINVNVNNYK